jgi:hypothetical protein
MTNFLLIALSFFLLYSSTLRAQSNDTSHVPSVDDPPPAAIPATRVTTAPSAVVSATASRQPAAALDQKGKIEKINAQARTLSVGGIDFVFSKRGKAFIDGALVSLSDIKVGDLVAVTYFAKSDGSNFATRVIKGYKHSKKSKKTESKSD